VKSSEAKKLIGKHVVWCDTWCPKRGWIEREGVFMEVRGKNVLVEQQGSNDWKWLPDMANIKAKAPE
jgi:hypothetical protein